MIISSPGLVKTDAASTHAHTHMAVLSQAADGVEKASKTASGGIEPVYTWTATSPTGACPTACGHGPSTLAGKVLCRDSRGSVADERQCSAADKPQAQTTACAATPACMIFHWEALEPAQACPTQCGQAAHSLSGKVVCKGTDGSTAFADKLCSAATKLAPKTKACKQTAQCDTETVTEGAWTVCASTTV